MKRLTLAFLFLLACGDDDDDVTEPTIDGAPGAIDAADQPAIDAGDSAEDLDMKAEDFECIKSGTKVRKFYVWNKLGHLDEALAVANSPEGGTFPPGTVLQLVPQEAMVKRRPGWDPTTNDWEFFFLGVNARGTTIEQRGAAEAENAFGGNCFGCHSLAEEKWDLICDETHGCDPLPIGPDLIQTIQDGDPRCN
jgi:hypothetical protein